MQNSREKWEGIPCATVGLVVMSRENEVTIGVIITWLQPEFWWASGSSRSLGANILRTVALRDSLPSAAIGFSNAVAAEVQTCRDGIQHNNKWTTQGVSWYLCSQQLLVSTDSKLPSKSPGRDVLILFIDLICDYFRNEYTPTRIIKL